MIASIELFNLPLLLAALAVMAVAALAFIEPAGVMCAVLFSLPWFFHPIATDSQVFAISELLLLGAIIGIAGSVLSETIAATNPLRKLRDMSISMLLQPLIWTILVLSIVGLILALRPYDPTHRADSFREWRWTLLEPLTLMVMLTVVAGGRPRARALFAAALIAGATAAALQAFSDFAIGGGIEFEGVTRIVGPYPHPNALALYVTRVAALALGWLVFNPSLRRWLLGPTIVVGAAVAATFSRGALVALALSAGLVLPVLGRRPRLTVATITVVAATALVGIERERMLDLFGGGSGSLRIDIWTSAIQMIRDRPLRGYGPDQFLYAYVPRYIEPTAWNERFTAHSHNLIFDFWIRLGIIGGAFAIGAMVLGATRAYVVVIKDRASKADALTAGAAVSLVAVLAHGMVDNAYFTHDLAMSGWFLAWLAFAPGTICVEGRTSSARPRRWRCWVHRLASVR